MKIKLEPYQTSDAIAVWRECEPFVQNKNGVLIHRVRSVAVYKCGRFPPHLAVHHWCGSAATGKTKFTFLAAPPEDKLLCAACESNALVRGLPSANALAGRHVHLGGVKPVQICCEGKV